MNAKTVAIHILCCGLTLSLSAAAPRPVPIEDLLRIRTFAPRSPLALSPDGEIVAYTLESQASRPPVRDKRYFLYSRTGVSTEAAGRVLWITDVFIGNSKKLIEGDYSSWGPSWAPDGRRLAFYSDAGGQASLWIWERSTGVARQVSPAIVRPLFGYEVPQWTPDSSQVLVKLLPGDLTLERATDLLAAPVFEGVGSKVSLFISDPTVGGAGASERGEEPSLGEVKNRYISDLALVRVATGTTQIVARHCLPTAYFLSPDGTRVAFSDLVGWQAGNSQAVRFNIVVAGVGTKSKVVASDVRMSYGRGVSWSPDGLTLAYITSGPLENGDVFIVPTAGGGPRKLTVGQHPDFGVDHYAQPLWSASGKEIYSTGSRKLWVIDIGTGAIRELASGLQRDFLGVVARVGNPRAWSAGGSMIAITRDAVNKRVGFYKIDIESGRYTRLLEEDKAYGTPLVFGVDTSPNTQGVVFVAQDAKHPADVWLAEREFRTVRQVTHTNPKLDAFAMGTARIVEWKNQKGDVLRGTLLTPPDQYDSRNPVIIDVYGGRNGADLVNRFGLGFAGAGNAQALATRGYAVFVPEVPLRVGTPMRDVAAAVLPGVDRLVALGVADPDRLGVTGASYGGYCTLAILVQTTRFRAALVRGVAADLFSAYATMQSDGSSSTGWAEEGQGRMGGTPWQYRDRYFENSPFFFLDRVTTPLLIVQGETDEVVPPFLSEQVFVGLRRLGKVAVYAKYLEGEHSESSLGYADSLDYFNRMIDWFDKWLGVRPDGNPTPTPLAKQ